MHANEPLWMRETVCDCTDRYRGRIGCEHTVIGDDGFELLQQAALGLELFEDCLDYQSGARGRVEAGDRFDPLKRQGCVVRTELALRNQFFEGGFEPG